MKRSEVVFIGIVLMLIASSVVFDTRLTAERDEPSNPRGALISTGWYCPSPPGESVNSIMSTANVGGDKLRLRRWAIGGGLSSDRLEAELPPRRRTSVALRDLGSDSVGLSEAFGSHAVSDLSITDSSGGATFSRCSEQPWNRWYFAQGSTLRGRNTYLVVANPFREEAVIRVRFITPDQDIVPARLKDVVIPQLSQSVLFLEEFFTETASFALDVSATRGRVVVSRYIRMNTRDGIKGSSLEVGARQPAQQWFFAGGEVPAAGEEMVYLMNPGEEESLVSFALPTETEQLSPPALQEIPVPAGRQVAVKLSDHLPRGAKHSLIVSSANAAPIVAERETIQAVPGAAQGVELAFGIPASAERLSVPVGGPVAGAQSVAILNASSVPAIVRGSLLSESGEWRPPELQALRIDPGRRLTVDMTPFVAPGPAVAVFEAVSGSISVEGTLLLGAPFNDHAGATGQPF